METRVRYAAFVLLLLALPFSSMSALADTNRFDWRETYANLHDNKWIKLTFGGEGTYTAECRRRETCLSDASDPRNYIEWRSERLGIGTAQNKTFDGYIEALVEKSKTPRYLLFMDSSHPTLERTYVDRAHYAYRFIVNKVTRKEAPNISINRWCIGDFSCRGCLGWACGFFLKEYPNYINEVMEEEKFPPEDGAFKYIYRRYSIIQSASHHEFLTGLTLRQYMKLKDGRIERFDCIFSFTEDTSKRNIQITACLLNALGFMGVVDLDRHLYHAGGRVYIKPELLRMIGRQNHVKPVN